MNQAQTQSSYLSYQGLSCYHTVSVKDQLEQCVSLFTDEQRSLPPVQINMSHALSIREGLKALIAVNGIRSQYQPLDADIYQAYAEWRRSLSPSITPIEQVQSFYEFLAENDPKVWLGCDPTLSLNQDGLTFEILDPTARVYAAMHVPPQSYEISNKDLKRVQKNEYTAQFEAGTALRESLARIHSHTPLHFSFAASADNVSDDYKGKVKKVLPTPMQWQRNFTQLLSATTLETRRVSLSRMDLYNLLQQLRLNADIPKKKKGIRFELIPGKQPVVTLQPWNWRMQCSADVYQGPKAEVIGIWDRRDLMIFDALLPYIQSVDVDILGEAQPTFWHIHCEAFTFTLASMGFRPNNWSRGILLDTALPRTNELNAKVLKVLSKQSYSTDDLAAKLAVNHNEIYHIVRANIQRGMILYDPHQKLWKARTLFTQFEWESSRYRHEREAHAYLLQTQKRVQIELVTQPTGELEVIGDVSEPQSARMPTEPHYAPKFQIIEGAGMRKVSCDCAWMKDKEKQKIGPCSHVQALWLQYSLDEAQRQAEMRAHPERVEMATVVYMKRKGDRELSRQLNFKRKVIEECWHENEHEVRRMHRVFNNIGAARTAFFQRVADLELRDFMDASQS
jgi:hypothetical protein